MGHVRLELEASGVIPVIPVSERAARPRPPQPSRTRAALDAGATSSREVANATGVSMQAAWKARRLAIRRLAQAAAGERAARSANRALHISERSVIPEPVELGGLCVQPDLKPAHRHIWTSDKPADRELARRYCKACSVQVICLEWSVDYADGRDSSIYGGRGITWRRAQRAVRDATSAASPGQAGTVA